MTVCHLQQGRGAKASLGVSNYLVMQWSPRGIFRGALSTLAPRGLWLCSSWEIGKKHDSHFCVYESLSVLNYFYNLFPFSSFSPHTTPSLAHESFGGLAKYYTCMYILQSHFMLSRAWKKSSWWTQTLAGIVRATHLPPCWEASAFAYSCLLKYP